jgi:hypothetical protein
MLSDRGRGVAIVRFVAKWKEKGGKRRELRLISDVARVRLPA